jgi:hypothetical protein
MAKKLGSLPMPAILPPIKFIKKLVTIPME